MLFFLVNFCQKWFCFQVVLSFSVVMHVCVWVSEWASEWEWVNESEWVGEWDQAIDYHWSLISGRDVWWSTQYLQMCAKHTHIQRYKYTVYIHQPTHRNTNSTHTSIHPHTHIQKERSTHTHVFSETHRVVEASIKEAIGADDRDTRHSRYSQRWRHTQPSVAHHHQLSDITINYRTSEAELPAHSSTSHKNYSIFTSSATFCPYSYSLFLLEQHLFLNI